MGSAAQTVLSTPELLELVLVQLPSESLLQAQLIAREFNDFIRSNVRLQQALFLLPEKQAEQCSNGGPSVFNKPRVNPILYRAFPPFFKILRNARFSFEKFGRSDFESLQWAKGVDWKSGADVKAKSYQRAEASWRKMLVTQPPIKKLEVFRGTSAMGGSTLRKAELLLGKNGQGATERELTMGILYDLVEEAVIAEGWNFDLDWCMFEDQEDLNAHTDVGKGMTHDAQTGVKDDATYYSDDTTSESDNLMKHGVERHELRDCLRLTLEKTYSCVITRPPRYPKGLSPHEIYQSHGAERLDLPFVNVMGEHLL